MNILGTVTTQTATVLEALYAYYEPLAIGNNPASTQQEIETALIDFIFML